MRLYVLYFMCFTCLPACVLTCLACLHAYVLVCLRAYVLLWLACLVCLRTCVLVIMKCFIFLRVCVLGVLFCLICFIFQYFNLKILTAKNVCALLSWTCFLFKPIYRKQESQWIYHLAATALKQYQFFTIYIFSY